MNLLLIHGRAQEGRDPVAVQGEWDQALDQGLLAARLSRPANLRVVFPFYGDRLDELVDQIDAPLMEEVVARGGDEDDDQLQFQAELYAELAAGASISGDEIQAHFAGSPQERGPLNWKWVHAILKALDRTPLGDRAIDRFTRDVYVYLKFPAVRRAIDRIVSEALTPGEWVVIGHSLGSVVGYHVLRDVTGPDTKVVRYVTVGSPLGVRAIRNRLTPPLVMPRCVESWYNAYDTRDVVSLYPLDAHNFPTTPPIENNGSVDNFTDNRHGISGYLNDANVARNVVELM